MKQFKRIGMLITAVFALAMMAQIFVIRAEAADYGIVITKLGKEAAQDQKITLNYKENGKMTCTKGLMTYVYKSGSTYVRQRVEFTESGWTCWNTDENGNKKDVAGSKESTEYDFQSLLSRAKSGGLTIRFYAGTYNMYGPYRIYANTTLLAPSKSAVLKKAKNTFMFINTDDTAAGKLNTVYGGDGNIKFEDIVFDMGGMNSQIGKFMRAQNIDILSCTFQNGNYKGHVFELCAIDTANIKQCKFLNFLKKNTTTNITANEMKNLLKDDPNIYKHEIIQIEAFPQKEAMPYGKFKDYSNSYRSRNIIISNNDFQNIVRGIGNHAGWYNNGGGAYCENIKLYKNTFKNVMETCINVRAFHNFYIWGNTAVANTTKLGVPNKNNYYDVNLEISASGSVTNGTVKRYNEANAAYSVVTKSYNHSGGKL